MTIGVYTFELRLYGGRSLKSKRQVLRRLKDRLRSRHNLAIAELNQHADTWQRAGLAVVSLASNRDTLVRLFEAVRREAEAQVPGQFVETGTEFIDGLDSEAAGPRDWCEP